MLRYHAARALSCSALLIAAVSHTQVAHATQAIYVPVERMAKEAAVIVYAEVGAAQVKWSKERRIVTMTELRILTPIKGAKVGTTTLYQVGGTLDGVTMEIPGAHRLVQGERIVLFAQRYNDMLVTYGVGQGKFTVTEVDGTLWVEPEFGDVAFVQRTAQGFAPAPRPAAKKQTLESFVAQVRHAAFGDLAPRVPEKTIAPEGSLENSKEVK